MFAAMLLLFMMIIIQSIESLAKKKNLQIFSICVKLKKIKFWEQVRLTSNQRTRKKEYYIYFFLKNTRF